VRILQAKHQALSSSASAASPIPSSSRPPPVPGVSQISSADVRINQSVPEKRGGGGTVSQAIWNGRPYAMKKPHLIGSMTDEDKTTFLKEMRFQACLKHPNCVQLYAYCIEPNNVFMLMEWMHGGSLSEQLRQSKGGGAKGSTLSARKRLAIMRDVCDGLQYMHSKAMVHGDIKSLNVLLDQEGKTAKLCDFGLTTMGLTSSVMSRNPGGTFAWSAPEILCYGHGHTPQSDVYALGILMWELLTSAQPFGGLAKDQIFGLLMQNQRPLVPNPIPSGFSRAYVALMRRCWDQDPAKRPSASQVHQCMIDLDESTQPNEPVELFPLDYQLSATAGGRQDAMLLFLESALPEACCAPVLRAIVAEAEKMVLTPSVQQLIVTHGLGTLEAQSIFVYTASQGFAVCPTHGAPFCSYNAALRGAQPQNVDAWRHYSFLLYNALLKLPSVACTVYRGLNVPLSELSYLYWKGGFVWLRSPTSTTTDKHKTMLQFGKGADAGVGTFMQLFVKNAKEIETFSAVPGEQERLIPQNTCFKVLQALSAADVTMLNAFGTLPPNVDLVVVEEVRVSAKANAPCVVGILLDFAGDSRQRRLCSCTTVLPSLPSS
jgi:hypothetical protein